MMRNTKMNKQTNITEYRIDFLKQFDYYVRNTIGDEDITDSWLALGVPDEYTDEDLEEITTNDELWIGCVNCFADCCKRAGII